jgi:hypothetical protein
MLRTGAWLLGSALAAGVGCGGGDDGAELGVLEAQSGPFDGDIALDSDAPQVGDHSATLMLVDGEGSPLKGASVHIRPFMPAHGHGSMEVEASETGLGRYLAEDVSLFMPGVWELRVHVVEGDAEGRLVAAFEVR